MKKLILASTSKRRQELLKLIDYPFDVIAPSDDEILDLNASPTEQLLKLAQKKAEEVFDKHPDAIVIGSDTSIIFENDILGKPHSIDHAFEMLKKLQGKKHEVITTVAMISKEKKRIFKKSAFITFYPMSDYEIREYVKTKEPLDKAGSYGIQGKAAIYIENMEGDYYTVMGLPIAAVYQSLKHDFKLFDKKRSLKK